MKNMKCIGGDDCTLIYFYRCESCGTIVLEDHSMEECLEGHECPTCYPKKYFPFRFFTRQQLKENKTLGLLVGKRAGIMF